MSHADPEAAGPQAEAGRILVVCTGNVCRSPYVERVLASALAGTGVVVRSAGTAALVGSAMDPSSAELLTRAGLDAGGFVSRQLTPEMVMEADLVITATRAHRRDVVQLVPAALERTFALVDLADLTDGITPDDVDAAPGRSRVARLAAAALARRPLVTARQDDGADIVDPFRQEFAVFEQMEQEARGPLGVVARALRGA